MVEVFKRPLYRRYYAGRVSRGYLLWLTFTLICIFLPYFIAFATRDFWKKQAWYREQPATKFKYKILMMLETNKVTSPVLYSTVPEYNTMVGQQHVRLPSVRATESDLNLDRIIDAYNISVAVPLAQGEVVHRATLLAFFDCVLSGRVRLAMEGLVYIDQSSYAPGSQLDVFGDLEFKQVNPLHITAGRTTYLSSVFASDTIGNMQDVHIGSILQNYTSRNETLKLGNEYTYWYSTVEEGEGSRKNDGASFTFNVNLRVPTQNINFVPTPTEVFKFAWVQYFALLFPIWFLTDKIRVFLYDEQIAPTYPQQDTDSSGKEHEF